MLSVISVDRLVSFAAFEEWLAVPGPWIGGFDLPFGLPRELVVTLGWPTGWADLLAHVALLGKSEFKNALNGVREARPMGSRYISRRGDAKAGSSSPMKLVNPPVGLMFFEGAPRLLAAGVSVVPCCPTTDSRVALEAYPGYVARQITRQSYKKDGADGRTPARRAQRTAILRALHDCHAATSGVEVFIPASVAQECVDDGNGDVLDAVLCAVQVAAVAGRTRLDRDSDNVAYGIPDSADPLEGWIATVPDS